MAALQQQPIEPSEDPTVDKWASPPEDSKPDDQLHYADPKLQQEEDAEEDAPAPPSDPNSLKTPSDRSDPSTPTAVPVAPQSGPLPPNTSHPPHSYAQSAAPLHQQPLPHHSHLHHQSHHQHHSPQHHRASSRDPASTAKIFVGGLSWETGEESLRRYFEQIGTVLDCVIMRDRHTGHPRGFGFVTFADDEAAANAASRRHDLDGRQVEAKRAVPRNDSSNSAPSPNASGLASASMPSGGHGPPGVQSPAHGPNPGSGLFGPAVFGSDPRGSQAHSRYGSDQMPSQGSMPRGHHTTRCKVFVGGLPSGCGDDEFRSYFSQWGEVVDAQVMIDHNTGNSRGFGFVTFASEATVTAVVGPGKSNTDHEIMGKCVEVKRAEPKGPPSDRRGHRDSYNSGGGGGGGMRAAAGSTDQGSVAAGSNSGGTNAAAAAAAAYYSNYPASLAEQYAYYNNPQWQQYFAAMGFNFPNAYPQGFNPYQQYLQAYMNNATAASAGNGAAAGAMGMNAGSEGAAGAQTADEGFDNSQGGTGRYGGAGGGGPGADVGGTGQNGHGSNNGGSGGSGGGGSRRSSRRDERYHPYR